MPSLPTSPTSRQQPGDSASVQHAAATPSQLDIIAAINDRAARQHQRQRMQRMAVLVGSAVLLAAALWWAAMQGGALLRVPAPPRPTAAAPAAETLRDGPAAAAPTTPAESPAAGAASPDLAAAPAQGASAASAPMKAAAVPPTNTAAADKRARQARTDMLQLQQERSREEAPPHPLREAGRDAQPARELPEPASPGAAAQAPAPAPSAAEPRPGVRELCSASRNIFSENFCHARECRKPEHANDAVCVRLRDIEQARPSGGSQ
jgi:hypothetical protein